MVVPSRNSVTTYGRGLSLITALLSPFFVFQNLQGEPLKAALVESMWMIVQAIQGRRLFYLEWHLALDSLIPYELYDGGPTLDKGFKVSYDTKTVGEYKIFDEGTLVIGWWKPDK